MNGKGVSKTDISVGVYLLAAVIFFIIPIPSILLDIMLAVNIPIDTFISLPACMNCEQFRLLCNKCDNYVHSLPGKCEHSRMALTSQGEANFKAKINNSMYIDNTNNENELCNFKDKLNNSASFNSQKMISQNNMSVNQKGINNSSTISNNNMMMMSNNVEPQNESSIDNKGISNRNMSKEINSSFRAFNYTSLYSKDYLNELQVRINIFYTSFNFISYS